MIAPDRPRRSALYLPASNPRALAKARTLPADVIVLDLEDAVAPEAKEEARAAAAATVHAGGFGGREVAIRVNGIDTPWGADDLVAAKACGADAILVPKVSAPGDIDRYEQALAGAPATLQMWAMIETCASIARLDAIAATATDTRLSLWVIGTNDLAKEMRATLAPGRAPFLPLLALAVVAARAHGLAVLDGVCNDFDDLAAFGREAEQGRAYGFDGKTLIHPAQVDPCNAVFSPGDAEVTRARAIVAAFARPENAGLGAIRVDGAMAELLHLDQARRLIAVAERIAAGA